MTRVLYITGWCRSGSTLLGNLLNELPGVAHVGELRYLWQNGVLGAGTNQLCGCGTTLTECPLWSAVLRQVRGDTPPGRYASELAAGQQRWLRTRHTAARLAEATGAAPTPAGVEALLERMVATYRAIATAGHAHTVVDSSKYPAEAAALCGRADLDLRVLHLVRDPRATAGSWRRAKAYIPAMGVWRSGGYWTAFNLASARIGRGLGGRYLSLTYEEFTARPREVLEGLMRWAGLTGEPPVDPQGNAVLGVNHTVTGNPDRLFSGPMRVRRDTPRPPLPWPYAALATVLALPALRRHGYGWRTR